MSSEIRTADAHGSTGEVALPALVRSLAGELARATGAAEALQHAIRLDGHVTTADVELMRSAQGLDLLTQELDGLRAFMQELADHMPAEWRVDPRPAAGRVVLSALKDRLSGSVRPSGPPLEEVEFF